MRVSYAHLLRVVLSIAGTILAYEFNQSVVLADFCANALQAVCFGDSFPALRTLDLLFLSNLVFHASETQIMSTLKIHGNSVSLL